MCKETLRVGGRFAVYVGLWVSGRNQSYWYGGTGRYTEWREVAGVRANGGTKGSRLIAARAPQDTLLRDGITSMGGEQ